ncbi:hypothetical protein [Hymenobacter jeollabukensis]|uniref:Uncharacterized protein n=1 Tax=Hymenobacter jeollabukensis TaxID=2025313 RepID=A0A5R8WUJ4_9BACT|nr:hypothetical protein [Hymenobacter jeollabukensis]TLM95085.1 hypothetical protein FDY95_04615 [Hymenobacter jeollabukensis]
MEVSAVPLQPARRADYLGWLVGLVVCTSFVFVLALAYIVAFQFGHPHLTITRADNLVMGACAVQGPLTFWGLVGTIRAAWHRRFGRAVVWLLFTVWALLLLVGGSFVVGVLIIGAHSVGEPPPDSPEGREMTRVDSLYSSPGFREKRLHD